MRVLVFRQIFLALAILLCFDISRAKADADNFPFGSPTDVTYAQKLWLAMELALLVGKKAMPLKPFFGGAKPHGTILEIATHRLTLGQHTGYIVVKRNYSGEGVSEKNVADNRTKYLTDYTVMYQRENGFDEDNQNWFWVKYQPNGTLFAKSIDGKPVPLAGKIFKGRAPQDNGGCIYCHSSAGGGDYIFYPNIKNK